MPPARRFFSIAAILVLGFGLRVWGFAWGLYNANVSRRPHPDEWPVYWLFHWFTTNHNLDPCPNARNACFFDWGTAFPYLAYAAHFVLTPVRQVLPSGIFGPHADPEFVWAVVAGRATSVVASTVTIWLVYRLASAVFDESSGVVAALAMAVCALPMQLAHFGTPDSTTILLLTLSLWLIVRAASGESEWAYMWAGVVVGLATGSEYHMSLLALPFAFAWSTSTRARHAKLPLIACLAAIAGYVLTNPYVLVHWAEFVSANEHTLRIRTVDSGVQYGDRWAVFGPAWLYVVRFPLGVGVGFAMTAWMLAGVAWSLYRRTHADLFLLVWVGVYFLLVTLSPAKFMRYSAPLLPVLAVLSGRFAVELFRASGILARRSTVSLLGVVCMVSFVYDGAYAALFSVDDSRVTAAHWLERRAGTGVAVTFEQLPNGLINLPYVVTDAGFRPCFSEFRPNRLNNGTRFLLTDNYGREEHPRIPQRRVDTFQRYVTSGTRLSVVYQVHNVPTFLGWSFSIDGAPHDWRYPSHVVTVYEISRPPGPRSAAWCFPSLDAATARLYGRS